MGRLTPSFRRLFLAEVEWLSQRFRPKLREPRLQAAFDALIRVWSGEHAAMLVSDIPLPLDAMNLVAAVDTQAELTQMAAQLQTLQDCVDRVHARTNTKMRASQLSGEDAENEGCSSVLNHQLSKEVKEIQKS